MTIRRSQGIAALLVAAGLGLTGCEAAQGASQAVEEPATLHDGQDGAPGVVTLSEGAQKRLSIQTAPVTAAGPALVMPYSALVYEPDGSSWAYVQTEPLTYQREKVAISNIVGDQAQLTSGPKAGSLVVTQGAAELVGVETGIDGEE
jgi:predicted small secreted protein